MKKYEVFVITEDDEEKIFPIEAKTDRSAINKALKLKGRNGTLKSIVKDNRTEEEIELSDEGSFFDDAYEWIYQKNN